MAEDSSTDTGDDSKITAHSNEGSNIQSEEIEQKIQELRNRGTPVSILVIGPAGVGKSELVNAMFGKDVAEVGHGVRSVTSKVHVYEGKYEGVSIKIYDTLGFRDTEGKSDYDILLDIDKQGKFDLVLICAKLEDRADYDMFLGLASVLNETTWKRAIVVLTFGNIFITLKSVVKAGQNKATEDKLKEYKEFIVDSLTGRVDEALLADIPFCIAGLIDERKLPTTDDWLKSLWDTCINRCSKEASPFLTTYASNRRHIHVAIAAASGATGAAIGATIGSIVPVVGTAIGAGVGAGIGAGVGRAADGVVINVMRDRETSRGREIPRDRETPRGRETPRDKEIPRGQDTPRDQETPKSQETLRGQGNGWCALI